jgi:acyl carrier protein
VDSTRARIEQKMVLLVGKISGRSFGLSVDSHLFNEAGLTSIGVIELVVEIEQMYGLDLMDQLSNREIQSIGEIIHLVYKHQLEVKGV